jgi:hypothetical protein
MSAALARESLELVELAGNIITVVDRLARVIFRMFFIEHTFFINYFQVQLTVLEAH